MLQLVFQITSVTQIRLRWMTERTTCCSFWKSTFLQKMQVCRSRLVCKNVSSENESGLTDKVTSVQKWTTQLKLQTFQTFLKHLTTVGRTTCLAFQVRSRAKSQCQVAVPSRRLCRCECPNGL